MFLKLNICVQRGKPDKKGNVRFSGYAKYLETVSFFNLFKKTVKRTVAENTGDNTTFFLSTKNQERNAFNSASSPADPGVCVAPVSPLSRPCGCAAGAGAAGGHGGRHRGRRPLPQQEGRGGSGHGVSDQPTDPAQRPHQAALPRYPEPHSITADYCRSCSAVL